MIILDTNVISALMRNTEKVEQWLNQYHIDNIWTTAINTMEVYYGIHLLPEGRKKETLGEAFTWMLARTFRHHIIEFDVNAAISTAEIAAKQKAKGNNVDFRDLQIAGIALDRKARIATRNEKDFRNLGLEVINPWE